MKGKILILFVTLVFLFASGCAEKDNTSVPEDSDTPIPEAGEALPPEDNISLKSGEDHIVRLENYGVIRPAELNISKGDTISWWSDKRQGNYVLVSEDGLFP